MRATADPPAGPASSRRLVPILALAALVNMTGALSLGPFLPTVADELGTSVALLGQVPSSAMLLAAVLGLVVGPLTDRYGCRRTLALSLLAVAGSALGMALAPSLLPLLLGGLLVAVGRAAVVPTAQTVVGAHFLGDRRRRAISWIMTGHSGAALLGIPLLTTIAAFANWRVAFAALGGLALVVALLLWRLPLAEQQRGGRHLRLGSVLAALASIRDHRPTLAVIGASFVGGTGSWAAFTYFGAYLAQRHGFTTGEVGWGYLVSGIGVMLGTRLVGTRLGARPLLLLGLARTAGGLAFGTALLLPLPAQVALGLLVLGATADLVSVTATAVLLAADSAEARATVTTVNNAALSLGVACGGALGGLALALGGYSMLGLVSLAWLLGAAALVRWSGSYGAS